jgi:hypothetical protein
MRYQSQKTSLPKATSLKYLTHIFYDPYPRFTLMDAELVITGVLDFAHRPEF